MLRIRVFEERVAKLLEDKEIKCPSHLCIGQEAVAAGVCSALRNDDHVFGTHRSHGHFLAKGGDMRQMMAELYGKQTGCSKGRGGSMHLTAPEVGFIGSAPIVSGIIPLAVGSALSSRLQEKDRVTVAFFGDGAVDEGVFHESLNFAALKKLPVVFVCENNFFSTHLHIVQRRICGEIFKFADVYGMAGGRVDGNNAIAVYRAACESLARARSGDGPTLLECLTYRWRGHVGPALDLEVGLGRKEELPQWVGKDPITRLKEQLLAEQKVTAAELEKLSKDVQQDVEEAVIFARESPYPDEKELLHYVFDDQTQGHGHAKD